MEYGQVVLLLSDGSEGQALNIRKDVCFGRDHPAHIRIKSKSVAAQHARIHVDSSGTCFLQYLNSSSRPRINGVRMSSKRRDNLSLLPCSAQLHHLDVITIAGRSFLFKSKSGAVVGSYTHDGESTAMSMKLQGKQRQGDNIQRVDQEVDSMSLDSKGSRRSTNSQKSYNSAYSVNTVSTSGHSTENAFARIHLLKKDGSEGSSYAVIRELSFGSQRPANIRIKSTNLEIVHVKLVVDILRNKCSLVHVADKFPPKVNGRRIHSRSAVWLGNNDVISIVGRDFIFRTDVSDTLPWNDVENIDATTRCKHDAGTSLRKAKRTSRAFGRTLDENSGVFAAQSPTKLQINTVTLSGKVSSPLHSLSSVSSLSASESDAPKSPLTRPLLEVFPSSDGGDHHDISKSTTYKTFRTGEKYAPRDKSTTKHVQFERESTSFTYGSDSDHMDDEDDFFDIIAEADRLMLSHEEKFAVQVEYNRLALEEVCKVSDVKRRDEVNTAANVSKEVVESDDDEGRKDVDNISPSLPQFHDETSDEEGIAFNVTTTCFISNTDMSGVKSAECEKFPVEDDCTQEMDTSSTYAPRNSEVVHSASESLGSEECVNKIAGAHDNKLEATLFDYIVDSETRNACVAMEQQPESEGASTAASTVASTVASPGAASISQLPVVESENSVVASTVMLPHAVDTSNMNHVIRLLLSLALLEPLSKYHLEANEVYSVDDVDDIEDELKTEGDEFAVMLRPPPDAPSGKRQQGVWCLHTFRYLSRSWRGFF